MLEIINGLKLLKQLKISLLTRKAKYRIYIKLYKDYRRKYQNIVVADENDARPIEEQLRDIFGDGPIPEFSNPEFRKKK